MRRLGASVEEHRLDNGMRVIIGERHLDPVVAAMVFYRVGARNEREDEAGVSHFLEHMMFKGSRGYAKGEVDLVTTKLGGSNNAYTSWDHTAYWFQLASDRWKKALEIEADRMANLLLDPAEFAAEKEVVLEELSMGLDDPWRVLSDAVQTALFPRHPYRRPIIGYPDTLRLMTPDVMRDYYRRFYHPGNATLVLCGDVDPTEALAAAREHFGAIPAGPAYEAVDPWRGPTGELTQETRLGVRWDDPANRLCIAWPTVRVGTDEDYALDVLTTVLTGGRLSRLHRRLVLVEGLATSISTSNDTRVEGGSFWLFAECAGDVEPAALEAAVDQEFSRVRDELVSAKELAVAKAMLDASDAYEHETVSDLAEDLGEYAVDATWQLLLENSERTQRVTAKQVRDVARKYLVPVRSVVGWCTPNEEQTAKKAARKPGKPKPGTPKERVPKKTAARKTASKTATAKKAGKRTAKKTAARKKVTRKSPPTGRAKKKVAKKSKRRSRA